MFSAQNEKRDPVTRETWRNWAGNQVCAPTDVVRPTTEAELREAVRTAGRVKAIGSGHSFTGVALTNGRQVSLEDYGRVLHIDREEQQVTVQAGIPLWRLCQEIAPHGLSLANMGDIAYQSVAGATSTGTHGTGIKLGGISTQIAGFELVTADGEIVRAAPDEEADLYAAGRVGLGALGVLSTVTLQCVPSFNLKAVEKAMHMDKVFANLDDYIENNDHFEFFWIPHTKYALTKRNNRTDEPATPRGRWATVRDKYFLENIAFGALNYLGRLKPDLIPKLNTALPGSSVSEYVEPSHQVFASPRWVRFVEMEYAIPRAACQDVLQKLEAFVDDSGLKVSFPVEVRFTAADDIWLSTASARESCYIAIHMFKGTPYEQYFRGFEAIVDQVGGRPHWGKMHYQTAATLSQRYARFYDFVALRDKLDPERKFTNDYLDRVLGA